MATTTTPSCPYPDCDGSATENVSELRICRACRRPSARCPSLGRDGRGRCKALNRPLARFCRVCGWPLPSGWAEDAWARDEAACPGEGPLVLEPDPYGFIDLTDRIAAPSWDYGGGPTELVEAGGRVWVGGSDGRHVLVEPFSGHVVALDPSPVGRPRALAAGPWLVIHGARGVQAVNLLAVDDPRGGGMRPLTLWSPSAGRRIASRPVVLRGAPGTTTLEEPFAAWVAEGSDELALAWSTLPIVSADRPTAGLSKMPGPAEGGPTPEPGGRRLAVAPVPSPGGDGLLVRSRTTLWLLPGPLGPEAPPPRIVRLLDRDEAESPLPGLVYLPESGATADDPATAARGTIFVARRAAEPGGVVLDVVRLSNDAPYVQPRAWRGVPLGSINRDGPQVLCLDGPELVLRDVHGQARRVDRSEAFRQLYGWASGGRLVAAVCTEVFETRKLWVTYLADLASGVSVGMLKGPFPAGVPVMLGPHVLAIESAEGGASGFGLAIRRIFPRSALSRAGTDRSSDSPPTPTLGLDKNRP